MGKFRSVTANSRRRAFVVETAKATYELPYARLEIAPSPEDPIVEVYPDEELGKEAFTYELESGLEGTVHLDQVLDYNRDPVYLTDLLLYRLTVEAEKRLETSGLGIRQLARRLGTSPSQVYAYSTPPTTGSPSARCSPSSTPSTARWISSSGTGRRCEWGWKRGGTLLGRCPGWAPTRTPRRVAPSLDLPPALMTETALS